MKALSRTRTHQLLGLLLAFSLYSCADESEGPGSGEADGGDDSANTDDATSSSDDSSNDESSSDENSDPSNGDPSNSDPSSGDGSDTDDSDAASDTDSEGTNSDDSETAVTDDTDGAGGTSSDATSTDSDMSGGAPGVGGAGGSNSGGAGTGGAAGADGNAGAGGLTGSGGAGGNSGEPSVDSRCADALPEALAGAGSADDPYLLCLAEQLRLLGSVAYPLDAAYALGDDLDASTLVPALPTLGSVETPFNGSLDGRGHLLVGLTASLFQAIETDGQVLDLRLSSDVDASMESTSWGLLTKNNSGTVRGVEGSGTIIGGDHVGMLIGTNQGLVEDCFVSGSVISEGAHIGGLMGVNLGTVRRSGSTVTVSGRARVGSLVGRQSAPGLVEECYALGSATSDQFVGGLIGTAFGGEILNSYARSVLVTGLEPGGLVGDATSTTITNSYAASALSGDGAEGLVGLAAADASTVTNSYFLDTATGSLGTALSAEQMTLPASFSGWDFDAVWQLDAGAEFPSLRFESGQ